MATPNAIAQMQEARDKEQTELLKDIQQKLDWIITHLGLGISDESPADETPADEVPAGDPPADESPVETSTSDKPKKEK